MPVYIGIFRISVCIHAQRLRDYESHGIYTVIHIRVYNYIHKDKKVFHHFCYFFLPPPKKNTMTLFLNKVVKYACLTVTEHCNGMTVLCIRIGSEQNFTSTNRKVN